MTQKTLTKQDLNQFTGTEQWYRHSLVPHFLYTDGVQHVAEAGGAYWLIDEIAFVQHLPAVKAEEFQSWQLQVRPDQTALLTCGDGNGRTVHSKTIAFTDFPLDEIDFYFTNQVLMLPSEY